MTDMITTTGTGGLYSNYCANRLPCGVCRIMMCQCPVFNGCGVTPVPTWNPNEITCKKVSSTLTGQNQNWGTLVEDTNANST